METNKISKIVNTIFSCKTNAQIKSVSKWLDSLYKNKIIDSCERNLFGDLIIKHIENLIDLTNKDIELDIKNTIIADLKSKIDNLETKPSLELDEFIVEVVKKEIFNYFIQFPEYRWAKSQNVYNLPLNINLIESVVCNGRFAAKVYLQKPGLLIGRGGRTIDDITENVNKVLGTDNFQILIVETFGRHKGRGEW